MTTRSKLIMICEDNALELIMFVIPLLIGLIMVLLKLFNILNITLSTIMIICLPLPITLVLFYAILLWTLKNLKE